MEIFGITFGYAALWIAAAVLFIIIEVATQGLATIWFAGGAILAAVSTLFISSILIQFVIFLSVSILLLYLTKPLQAKYRIGKVKTNIDAIVGKIGFVEAAISPTAFGQVKVGGLTWTAVSADPCLTIEKGTKVTVEGVEGIKLIVTPAPEVAS